MLEQQRHRLILDLLEERQFVRLQELVEALNASPATVRRDINKLAEEGLLTRIHGAARGAREGHGAAQAAAGAGDEDHAAGEQVGGRIVGN